MNLKESFRYQRFLDGLMHSAAHSIRASEHCYHITKRHLMNAANPDAEDKVEEVEPEVPFFQNDDVIRFMEWLTEQKLLLSVAIGNAKASAGFDIDAAIEANKFRQELSSSIRAMLNRQGGKRMERGSGYKFNNDGVQAMYYYDIETTLAEAFDRNAAKSSMLSAITRADEVSAEIDSALINITVDYEPVYNVNESFEDVMTEFLSK